MLDAFIAVAESPVELRRVSIPLIDSDLDDGSSPGRGSNQQLGRPHDRGADPETLKRRKNAEGPEMDDAFLRLPAEVDAESSDRLPVRQRQKKDDIVASFGRRLSHVV